MYDEEIKELESLAGTQKDVAEWKKTECEPKQVRDEIYTVYRMDLSDLNVGL